MSEQRGVRLDLFENGEFSRGRGRIVEAIWIVVSGALVQSWLPGSAMRVTLLRMFGADIGKGVVVKPRVTVKFPWRLSIGDHAWIGENVWIDNLARVSIGEQCCLSQGAYVCTGSHNWASTKFELIAEPVTIEGEAWICARATIAPGVRIGRGAVVGLGSVLTHDLLPWTIFKGNGPELGKMRILPEAPRTRAARNDAQ